MSPSWPLILEPSTENLLRLSAGSKTIIDFSIWCISSWPHLFIIFSNHSGYPHLVNSSVLLIFNNIHFRSWRNYSSRARCFNWNWLRRYDCWLGLHCKLLGLVLLLLPSSNFIIQELLLLLGNLFLHFVKFLLSILYNIVNFTIFNFCLELLVLFFWLFVDSAYFLQLLLDYVFGFFSETGAGALQFVAFFRSQQASGVNERRNLALLVLDSCCHLLKSLLSFVVKLLIVIISLLFKLSFNKLVLNFLLACPPELSNVGKGWCLELELAGDLLLFAR